MSEFNNDEYLKGQVKKQVNKMIETSYKEALIKLPIEGTKKLLDESLQALQLMVKNGTLTYEEIVSFYLDRIYKHEHLNAVLEINEHALIEAKSKQYSDENDMLYGMPILVKGNIATEGMDTTAGAAALKDLHCSDAEVVKLLKEKGAIILGKTNLSEWANFMSTASSNGYSSLGGQTKNPYGSFDVGGSSSGSAVACTCQLAPVTVGTETAGSIIYPASQNSIVGLKPTLGLISNQNIIPISESHDTAGPMARTVIDVYHLLKGMTEIELRKPIFKNDNLKGKKVGIIVNDPVKVYYRKGDDKIIDKATGILNNIGAEVIEYVIEKEAFETKVYDILKYEFREGVKHFLKDKNTAMKNLGDIIRFNEKDMDQLAPYNHEIIKQAYEECFEKDKIKAQIVENRHITRQALDLALNDVDVLMTLSNYCTSVYAPAGYPAICIPAGYRENGEPIGVTFIASGHEDIKLLEMAYAFEKHIERHNP